MSEVFPGSGDRAGGLSLDPRTKLLVVVAVSGVLLSTSGDGSALVEAGRWTLVAAPFVLLALSRRYATAARYLVTYAVLAGLPLVLWQLLPGDNAFLALSLSWFGGLSLILPGMTCGLYALRTTTATEFIAAMQRLRCPDALTIPAAIIFRFVPTVEEEYRSIRTAMRMRGIGGIRQPVRMLEYRLVPLLVSVVGIGNELSMSAVTRGLGSGRERTSICTIGFRPADGIAILLLVVALGMVVAGGGA